MFYIMEKLVSITMLILLAHVQTMVAQVVPIPKDVTASIGVMLNKSLFIGRLDKANLNNAQLVNLLNIENGLGKKSFLVKLPSIELVQNTLKNSSNIGQGVNEKSSFLIPVSDDSVILVENGSGRMDGGSIIFNGQVANDGGDVFLISRGDSISGYIKTKEKDYSVIPIGNGYHAIVDVTQKFPIEEPKKKRNPKNLTSEKAKPNNDVMSFGRLSDDETAEIRVLVLYTKNANIGYPNIETSLIEPLIQQTNQTLINSKLLNLKFVLAAASPVNYNETGGYDHHLGVLINDNDGVIDEVHAFRDKVKADIVVLLVNDNSFCGKSAEVGPIHEKDAFLVVNRDCSLQNYSFAHELGHIFGCRHDFFTDPDSIPFSYGHGFINGTLWRCVMSYPDGCGGCKRIPYWSNPDLILDGKSAGSKEREDNIEVMKQTAKLIASFRN